MTMSDDKSDESDFMNRWSRKKAEARTATVPEEEAIATPVDPEALPDQPIAALDPEAEAGDDADAAVDSEEIPPEIADIDIDSLDYNSDFTVFMKDNVPEVIRRRALRQLWRSNPILANVDGLNDYDDDFTDAALVVKGLKSAYKIGKGYLTDEDRDEEGKDEEAAKTAETAEAEATSGESADSVASDEDAEPSDSEVSEDSDAGQDDVADTDTLSEVTVDLTVDDPVKEV